MNIGSLDQLPTELLLHIANFVHNEPQTLVNLLPVCKKLYYIYRTVLYRDIWAIVSADEHFSEHCSIEGVRDCIISNGGKELHRETTLITSLRSLRKLANVLLENPELRTLIHSFNINALNFDAADRETSNKMLKYMREFQETGCHITERNNQKLFIHKPYLSDFQDRVFEASMLDFFQEPTRGVNISTYISQRRIIGDARELNEQKETDKKGMLMDIDPSAVNMVLFCPHDFEELNRDYGYVECIDSIRQLFQQGLKGEMSLLNLQNMMMQSSLRTSHAQNDLVFMSFMHYVIASSA
jgi:hypothetical protein